MEVYYDENDLLVLTEIDHPPSIDFIQYRIKKNGDVLERVVKNSDEPVDTIFKDCVDIDVARGLFSRLKALFKSFESLPGYHSTGCRHFINLLDDDCYFPISDPTGMQGEHVDLKLFDDRWIELSALIKGHKFSRC